MSGEIQVGDRLTFKSCTRGSFRKASRMVRQVYADGRVTVAYEGWSDFIVMPNEIISWERWA